MAICLPLLVIVCVFYAGRLYLCSSGAQTNTRPVITASAAWIRSKQTAPSLKM